MYHDIAVARPLVDPAPPPADSTPIEPAIICIPWPSEAHRRAELARSGTPRLLFVEPGADPPELWDLEEDWVRVPASVEEVTLRADTLRSRVIRRAG